MEHSNSARLFLFFYLMILSGAGFSQKHIAIIGSSSAAGYFPASSGLPKDSAWAFKLKKHYKDFGIIDTIINLAQSSTDVFEGMPSSYVPPASTGYHNPNPAINITKAVNLIPKPDVIIVNYPSNSYDWLPLAQVMSCLQTIKDSANIKNIKCYITTTQPRDGFSPSERQKLKTLRDMILTQFGEFAIDFFTDIAQEPSLAIKTEYAIGDMVHLNPAGHTILKNKVLEKNIFFNLVPVKFSELIASVKADKVILQWKTYTENNNREFIIETSRDGIVFKPLGTVAGKLNSSTTQQYSFTDHHPAAGQNYYRLAAISTFGEKEYSKIISIKFDNKPAAAFTATTSGGVLALNFNQAITNSVMVTIYTLQGSIAFSKKINIQGSTSYSVNIATLPAGKYFVRAIVNDRKESVQFVKF